LIPVLGAEGAAALHRRLVARTLTMTLSAGLCPVQCWYWPSLDDPVFDAWKDHPGISFHRQPEGDLGARMLAGACRALGDAVAAVLIGADCPLLEAEHLERALHMLGERDAVLGPAEDGGYVLLGLRRAEPGVFRGVDWGTHRVLEQTRTRLRALGWRWEELPVLWDLDRPEDLGACRTWAFVT